jgi:putative thiamine transport system substrate-binding protein
MTGSTALRSLVLSAALLGAAPVSADSLADFDALAEAARGETVFFHAWSGDPTINAYIEWAAMRSRRDTASRSSMSG